MAKIATVAYHSSRSLALAAVARVHAGELVIWPEVTSVIQSLADCDGKEATLLLFIDGPIPYKVEAKLAKVLSSALVFTGNFDPTGRLQKLSDEPVLAVVWFKDKCIVDPPRVYSPGERVVCNGTHWSENGIECELP